MRRFYEQTLWIPQNFPPTNPDLHHGLLSKGCKALCNSGLSPSASSRFIVRGLQPRSRSPYDFVNPRAVLISAVRARTSPARARMTVRSACAFRLRCCTGTQQFRVDSRQPGQRSGVEPIIFPTAFSDQAHVSRMGHDHFLPQFTQQPAHPRRMHPCFQRDPAARHPAEDFLHRLRRCRHLLFQKYFTRFIQNAVPTRSTPQIQAQRSVSDLQLFRSSLPLQC
jgi:hypothetical protein